MKIIIILALLVQSLLSCAQTIFPLNTPEPTNDSYIKDINNEFDPYLGTWEATWNNKKITLYLIKMAHIQENRLISTDYYYRDIVIGKYKVVDLSTGVTIEDTTNITNIDNMVLRNTRLNRTKNFLSFSYMRRGVISNDCDILSNINLYRDLSNPNILNYKYYVDSYNYDNCPFTNIDDIPVNIPKQEVVFHKL